ncbi:PHP domain-containing protein [Coprobacillaceae bacterium CR2/5/TPMF4]|nr:PHP domain-containing protein [Coprobacillaceae bacterium CR2/5/TPMF4]
MMLGHLQVYSSYSFQNSTILIDGLVKKASDLHFEALALTDKDNMYGAIEFFKAAKNMELNQYLELKLVF